MIRNFKAVLAACSLTVLLASCDFINPDEPAPSYIQVDTFPFDPSPTAAVMGPSPSSKIKDIWVYVDGEFQGTYELPARFPVLKSGEADVILAPGILLNGIAATHSPYPFYKASQHSVTLTENGTVTIAPTTRYFDYTECSFCEDFEGSGFSLVKTGSSDTIMYQLPSGSPDIFEGTSSGVVYLDANHTKFEVSSTTDYLLPGSGKPVYLELNYKINQTMQVGLFVNLPGPSVEQIPVINLNATSTWNKIYIELGYIVTPYAQTATGFKIYFGALKDPGVALPVFYLDNIKVVNNQ
ncbi:MAG TPA: hypothetical protein VFW78_12835 [Bacteroidia bacterium]|nr:hypothetical protein [Bacteroidia bacterium]